MAEKRKFRRLPAPAFACRVCQECRLLDLSVGGAFVESASPLPAGSEVTLEFRLPATGQRIIRVGARVIWSGERVFDRDTPCSGMGLAFKSVAPEDRVVIAEFLRRAYELTRGMLRLAREVPVRIRTHGGEWVEGSARELGEQGLLAETPSIATIGSEVEVSLRLPNATRPVQVLGIVLRNDPADAEGAPGSPEIPRRGLRIEFVDVSIAARELIRAFLEESGPQVSR